jgi:hypothetical protein
MLIVFDWVMALGSQNEIRWDKFCALVEQLVERVLSICCWLTEQDSARSVLDIVTTPGNSFTV